MSEIGLNPLSPLAESIVGQWPALGLSCAERRILARQIDCAIAESVRQAAGFDPAQRLPENRESVLALLSSGGGRFFHVAIYDKGIWRQQAGSPYREDVSVVCWWPLPGKGGEMP